MLGISDEWATLDRFYEETSAVSTTVKKHMVRNSLEPTRMWNGAGGFSIWSAIMRRHSLFWRANTHSHIEHFPFIYHYFLISIYVYVLLLLIVIFSNIFHTYKFISGGFCLSCFKCFTFHSCRRAFPRWKVNNSMQMKMKTIHASS